MNPKLTSKPDCGQPKAPLAPAWADSEEQIASYLRETFEGWVRYSHQRCHLLLALATVLLNEPATAEDCARAERIEDAERAEIDALCVRLRQALCDLEPVARSLTRTGRSDVSTPLARLQVSFLFFRFLSADEGAAVLWERLARTGWRVAHLWQQKGT